MAKRQSKKGALWKDIPDEHDFLAAFNYLSLICSEAVAQSLVGSLREAPTSTRKAEELLRASGLPLVGKADFHVWSEMEKISKGILLSPVLVVRGSMKENMSLVIADGYHRICASCQVDGNEDIPLRIVEPLFA